MTFNETENHEVNGALKTKITGCVISEINNEGVNENKQAGSLGLLPIFTSKLFRDKKSEPNNPEQKQPRPLFNIRFQNVIVNCLNI